MQEYKDFLTINKKFYNFYLDKMSIKTFRFYTQKFFPPTIWYTFNPLNCKKLQPIEKTLNLQLKEIPENIKEQFKENIIIQEKVLEMIKKRNQEYNYRCWLIKLTTWKWKSHIIMDLTNYYQTNTLILVHNIKTLWEMKKKFEDFTNIIPSIYWWWKKDFWKITIMTKKSFSLDYDKIQEQYNLIILDEAPVQFSKKFWDSMNRYCNNREWIAFYGLSWTPDKTELEVQDLERYFWKLIEIKWQINNWYNYIPKFTMYDYKYNWFYRYENPQEMRTAISENTSRLELQVKEIKNLLESRKCILILTDRKLEVENFYEKLWKSENEFCFCMTGETKEKDDNENLRIAKYIIESNNKVIIIWTIQKIGIWVDIPFIDSIFLASAIKFKSTVIQAIWRALRKYENKNDVICHIWNDVPILNNQRIEKIKTIENEYWVFKKDIIFKNI